MSWISRVFGARPDAGVRQDLPRLGPGGPPVGAVYADTEEDRAAGAPWWGRSNQTKRVSAVSIDASNTSRVISLFDSADRGFIGGKIDLIEDCRARDPRLHAVCATRVLGAQTRTQVIQPPEGYEGNPAALATAEKVRRALATIPGLRTARGHLAAGSLNGLGIVEFDWKLNRDGVRVPHPRFVHSNRTAWNVATEQLHRCEPGTQKLSERALCEYADKFAIHAPVLGMSTYPWRRGAVTPGLAILSMTKRMGIRWLMQLMERWGQPQVYAVLEGGVPTDGTETTGIVQQVLNSLRDLSTDWQALFPKGTTVDKISGSGEVSADLHSRFLDIVNAEEAIAILGQDWTTENKGGGSYAAVVAADRIRQDLLLADIQESDETFTEAFIEPIVRYNWPGEPVPRAVSQLVGKRPITAGEYQAGAFTTDELRESMGYSPMGGDDGAQRYPVAAIGAATNPAGAPVASVSQGDQEPAAIDVAAPTPAADVQDAALNGAQYASLQSTLEKVATGVLEAGPAAALIKAGFPTLSPVLIAEMLSGTVRPQSGTAPATTPPAPKE